MAESTLSKLTANYVKSLNDVTDVKDIITFLEAPWGLNLNETTQPLLPVQKFILRLYYKLPLNEKDFTITVTDKYNERALYKFTETEYLQFLYKEGRCNIQYQDNKPRNELVLVIGRRGSKCFTFDSFITTTVGTITVKELFDRLSLKEKIGIFTYNKDTWKKYITYNIKAEYNGLKPSLKITTGCGRSDSITTEHPYFVWRDSWLEPQWINASELQIGDSLAVARSQELFGNTSIGAHKAKLLGYLLGDGGLTSGVKFTNMNKAIINEIQEILTKDFPNHKCIGSKKNKVLLWLKEINEYNKKSKEKRIPDCIKKAPKDEISLFLNRLFSCDGYVAIDIPRKSHKSPKCIIAITSASKFFIEDIQRELLKFGIMSYCTYIKPTFKDKVYDAWKLCIADSASIIKFANEINIYQKEDKINKAKEICLIKGKNKFKLGYLPKGALTRVLKIKKDKNLKNYEIYGGTSKDNERLKNYTLQKEKAIKYAKNIGDTLLENIAGSEICWDKIKTIENLGIRETVALEVADTNIIGNDIISHNSTLSSWIAAYEVYRLLRLYHPQKFYSMLPDDEIHLTAIATAEDQANLLFRQITSHFAKCTYFHRYMNKPTLDRVSIRSRRDLEKYGEEGRASILIKSAACSARAVRGAGNILVIMDEQAHFLEEKSQSNRSDKSVYDAITPSVAQFGMDGKIINISSPLNKSGVLWDLYNQALSGAEHLLMIKAPSWEVNTTLSSNFLKARHNSDPVMYDCEFGADFSDRVKSWMPEDYLRQVIDKQLKPKSNGRQKTPYFMGVDIGLKGDGTSIAITHVEKVREEIKETIVFTDKIELDLCDVIYAGEGAYEKAEILDFELVADWIQNLCNKFYIVKGLIDQHNGVLAVQNLMKRGLSQFDMVYHTRTFNSDLYQNFMMLVIDKKLRLYNDVKDPYSDSELIEELLKLQVKQYSRHTIEVEAPKITGAHDDRADALVRSVWLATEALRNGHIGSGLSLANNRYTGIRDANQYALMKSRIHNITDNTRLIKKHKLHNWAKKYG